MKCLILAAGYATRLYPLTENFPKPLLEVGGKTILDWLLDDMDTMGVIDEYVVISNHKYYQHFVRWAATKSMKITVVDDGTSSNETRLGAVRDIQFAVNSLGLEDDMLVMAGDNLLDFSMTKFIRYALEKNAPCTMRYYEPSFQKLLKSGIVTVDENDKITRMTEKVPNPETNWVSVAFYYYPRETVRLIAQALADGCGVDAPGSFLIWVSQRTTSYAMEMPGHRYDVGNLDSYQKIKEEYKGITC